MQLKLRDCLTKNNDEYFQVTTCVLHGNHKSKTCNRYTYKRERYPDTTLKTSSNNTGREQNKKGT